jgi:F-type H+-transporting ATPase subunit delta
VQATAKRNLVSELASRLSLSAPLTKLLLMLADRDRLALVPDLHEVYQERLREHQQILQAEVTTAAPLDDQHTAALRSRLQAATGRQIMLTTKVDPSLIGGLVARIGSTVYDGSVSAQLAKMRERLLHER